MGGRAEYMDIYGLPTLKLELWQLWSCKTYSVNWVHAFQLSPKPLYHNNGSSQMLDGVRIKLDIFSWSWLCSDSYWTRSEAIDIFSWYFNFLLYTLTLVYLLKLCLHRLNIYELQAPRAHQEGSKFGALSLLPPPSHWSFCL